MSPQAGELLVNESHHESARDAGLNPIGSEDAEELAQDTIAICGQFVGKRRGAGKAGHTSNIAYYPQQIRQGRRSTGFLKNRSAAPGCAE